MEKRILVAEDNPDFIHGAKTFFSGRQGIVPVYAGDFEEVQYLLHHDSYSGALVDCFFPAKTGSGNRDLGRQVIEQIAGHYPRPTTTARAVLDEVAKYADMDDELTRIVTRFALDGHNGRDITHDPVMGAIARVGSVLPKPQVTQIIRNTLGLMYGDDKSRRFDRTPKDYYGDLLAALEKDEHNQPLGIKVAEILSERQIPFTLVTSTFHHDSLTQPIQDYAGKRGWSLVDCSQNKPQEKATPEFWLRAFDTLERRF